MAARLDANFAAQLTENQLRTIAVLIALGAAAAMASLPDAAQAGASAGQQSLYGAPASSQVEHVDYRRCSTRDGKRHCRVVRNGASSDDNAIPAYGAGRPENYRVGSAEWYRAMERDGRLHTEGSSP
jgi:hypothetical protein